eukprot:TRINITY_DN5337_c0_g2_i1.p2 TRINITY_DN5337_c0_g2~~TRINITY_DN5337_c0_g2_i1.p2  ORF type:complete len:126 (+),score=20.09 TRINITY_DN5337_c0_g2_i1:38-415(+)
MALRHRCRVLAGGASLLLLAVAWNAASFASPMPARSATSQRGHHAALTGEPNTDAGFGSSAPLGLGAGGVPKRAAVLRRGFLAMGQDAPRFTLPDESGNMVSLEDLVQKGMQVLIWWYPKAGTPG